MTVYDAFFVAVMVYGLYVVWYGWQSRAPRWAPVLLALLLCLATWGYLNVFWGTT